MENYVARRLDGLPIAELQLALFSLCMYIVFETIYGPNHDQIVPVFEPEQEPEPNSNTGLEYPVQVLPMPFVWKDSWDEEPFRLGGVRGSSVYAVASAFLHARGILRLSDDDLYYALGRGGTLAWWTDANEDFQSITLSQLIGKAYGEDYLEQHRPDFETQTSSTTSRSREQN